MNILFVCTGNTCRSPMAEGLLRAKAEKEQQNIVTLSAGLFCVPGGTVSPYAREAVKDLVDISSHQTRPLSIPLIDAADLVVGLSSDHKNTLLRQFPNLKDKIVSLGELAGTGEDVQDPFGGTQEEYIECAKQIEALIEKSWPHIIEKM
ncbi:low molecular weight protein arginine phosphatase [uncultured Veillonella sp.]|uniref:low molecular weight protein arginine phosphatase n=1 Tax=uncultured Veillonella sp. TaxID=159268 RepID=UPI0025F82E40|nr:low molecular weight protein arginine phosphatase [uncultured Veillonella sp.]MDY3973840.1 low molecular weight protein arginine phosphatase [Veillonella caviae]